MSIKWVKLDGQQPFFFQTDPLPILGSDYLPILNTNADTSTREKKCKELEDGFSLLVTSNDGNLDKKISIYKSNHKIKFQENINFFCETIAQFPHCKYQFMVSIKQV